MFDDTSTDDPFANVSFNAAVPVSTPDDISETLKSFNANGTPFMKVASAAADTSKGVTRVNENSSAHPGVVGYRDSKGQAVFTNIGTQNAGVGGSGANSGNNNLAGIVPINGPSLPLTNILEQLSKATDSGAARGLFATFQEAAAREQIKLQTAALEFAQNKIGVPGLTQQLALSEQADKASVGWYPGIGDSPITQKMRTELSTARGYADTEAKRYLDTNLSYKLLDNSLKQAGAELARVQKLTDRKALLEDSLTLRSDERTAQKQADLEQKAETMTAVKVARVQALSAQDFVDEVNPKVKAYQILAGHKDKNFQDAVNADDTQLPILALKGNAFAETLLVTQEAANTGMPTAQIKSLIASMKQAMDNPKFIENALKARYPNTPEGKKQMNEELGHFTLASNDPTKKQEVTETKARLALEAIVKQKTTTYLGDTSSWDSLNAEFKVAQDQAAKTTGKRTIQNTLTAFLGDTVGPERLQRAGVFDSIARTAAQRHSDSVFGKPDYRQAAKIISDNAVAEGTFRKWLAGLGNTAASTAAPRPMALGAMLGLTGGSVVGGPAGAAVGGVLGAGYGAGVELFNNLTDSSQETTPINPQTGKPFGE